MNGIAATNSLHRHGLPVVAIIATAVLVLPSACSSGPSSAGSGASPNARGSTSPPSALAFSRGMRSHGVPNFPDPDSSGVIPKVTAPQLGVSDSQFQAAQTACRNMLSNGGPGPPSEAAVRQAWHDSVKFAGCMRAHGVSNWPNPTSDPAHHPERPTFDLRRVGIDQTSPQIATKIRACEPVLHGWTPYVIDESGQTFLGGS